MMNKIVFPSLILLLAAGAAQAFLPPDAKAREPEIRAYRQQIRKQYEERIEERRAEAAKEYVRVKEMINLPPWERDKVITRSGEVLRRPAPVAESFSEKTGANRVFVSIILLLIIGSIVAWIKRATREVDE